jgi:hypothetical protein
MYFVISLGSVNGQRVLKYKYEFCSANDMSRSAIVVLVVDDIVVGCFHYYHAYFYNMDFGYMNAFLRYRMSAG